MKKHWKIPMILLMAVMALLSAVSAFAEDVPPEGGLLGETAYNVSYEYYDTQYKRFYTATHDSCEKLTSDNRDWKGWLVATSDVVISKRVTVNENVHLILGNNCTVTCKEGIEVETSSLAGKADAHLTIYAQPLGDLAGQMVGQLITTGDDNRAGIGSGYCYGFDGDICGEITIHGGYIEATGGKDAAGIGGGYAANGADVTIYGGEVVATGGENSAGIGGGREGATNTGGEGGKLIVYGGWVTATGGKYGAGIGGGKDGDGGSVAVLGGTVTANGTYGGAGIGGGDEGDGGAVEVRGGTVTAKGNDGGAGIGGGYNKGKGGTVKIHNGTVTAEGDEGGAGIGGGRNGKAGSVEIHGGIVTANGGRCGAGIGGGDDCDGGDVTVWGGTVNIYAFSGGAAIGGGYSADGGNVVLNGGSFNIRGSIDAHAIGRGEHGGGAGTLSIGQGLCVFDKDGKRINGGFNPQTWRDCEYFARGGENLVFSVRAYGDPVPYNEYDPLFGDDRYDCQRYTFVTKNIREWKDGWYVVDDSGTFNDSVTVSGDAHLIIKDGQTLTAAKGIRVEHDASLSVYAQSDGENRGKLVANGDKFCAGIGGRDGNAGGTVIIHGCDVTANGGQYAAGIGGGQEGSGGSFTIYDGRVSATAGAGAPRAIGSGNGGVAPGLITVRDECELYDEVKGENIQRGSGSFADWASQVNGSQHILTVVPSTSYLTDPIPYLYYDKNLNVRSEECKQYKLIRYDTHALNGGWYVLKDSITLDHPLSALGDVHIILTNGKTLTVNGGVCVNQGKSLTIHAQSEDKNEMGALIADASGYECAGIGANCEQTGNITIDGGKITAKGGEKSAGIGGSNFSGCGNIKIHGGIVDAVSTSAGAGIGSGWYEANFDFKYDSDDMEYDVTFYEWGENGSIEITGGTVHARGEGSGAGIGGGEGYDAGRVTISGGMVTAQGGDDGTGIGSGHVGYWDDNEFESDWRTAGVPGGTVNVTGGEVTAVGGGGTSIWEDERGAFMADTLNISSDLSVTVYGYNGKEILVEKPSQYASECRYRNKAVIKPGIPGDVPDVPKTGDSSRPRLWIALILASSMGLTACIVNGKRKRNEGE